jgi:pyrroline-5-carboxylate reductase
LVPWVTMDRMSNNNPTIGFIGAGNMATALIEGLLANGTGPDTLWASDTSEDRLSALAARGISTTADNAELVSRCSIVVLAVKPQVMAAVVSAIAPALQQRDCLLISIAAGITMASLQQWTHGGQRIVRCMPNTPALVGLGASGLYGNSAVSDADRAATTAILNAVGISCWLDNEQQLDAVTALSGSGPAYFFLMCEAMMQSGVALGLTEETARTLCLQTALGATTLASSSNVDVVELRRRVTSPGGTTEAAIRQFESDGLREVVQRAMQQAADRSRELASG